LILTAIAQLFVYTTAQWWVAVQLILTSQTTCTYRRLVLYSMVLLCLERQPHYWQQIYSAHNLAIGVSLAHTCKRQWTKVSQAFPESYTAYDSRIQHLSNGRQREDKRAKNSTTRWVSAQLSYVCISAWQQSRQCGQNLV